MRKIVVPISVLLLSAAWAAAQSGGSYSNESPATTPVTMNVTILGCLAGDEGGYTLTDRSGATYQLTGDTGKLRAHVGHMMQVTGVSTSVMHQPGSMSEGRETQPTLSVVSFKHISSNCGDSSWTGSY